MMMTTAGGRNGHLTVEETTAYVDAAVSPEDRPRIEAHLADCNRCRDEVVAVRETMRTRDQSRRSSPRQSVVRIAGLAAAAVLAGLLLIGPRLLTTNDTPRRRGQEAADIAGPGRLEVLAPDDGARLSGETVRFEWRSAGPETVYELTLTDEIGDVVADTTITDTTLVLPARGELHEGGVFFWFVDALRADGSSVSSGARQFELEAAR